MSQVERSIDHTVDTEASADEMLANLNDRQENRWQMQEIARRTVEPGLMQMSVLEVTSAENSQTWAIDIEHPARDDPIRIFAEKPMDGWSRDYKIVKMLDWVGKESSRDPHALEFHDLYMKKDEEQSEYAHGWMVVEPPDYDAPIPTQLRRKWRQVRQWSPSWQLNYTHVKMYGFLLAGALAGPVLETTLLGGYSIPGGTLTVVLVSFLMATVIGLLVLDK